MQQNITEITINAMFYVYFVVLAGGLGLVTAGAIGFKVYKMMNDRSLKKTSNNKGKKVVV